MKNLAIVWIAVLSLVACQTGDKKASANALTDEQKSKALKDSANFTTIQWLDSTFKDLGKVKEGAVVEVSYRFKNTGNHNLIIADVTAGCGCTTPDKPQEPIAPGKEGVIKAKFNSENHPGENRKDVYVLANTVPQSSDLVFHVEVTK
ncbi:MAG: DUF1573 domain-containing protein [Bacteroidota bacterium]|nr:DUF1573 domain-containing protein [Bacteroidota bacterium]